MTKEKIKKFVPKFIKIIIAVLIIVLLPDLLFRIRILVKEVPYLKNHLYNDFSDKEYVQSMMGILVNCVAVSVSIFACYVAKVVGRTQIVHHQQEILMAAIYILRNIKKNSQEIYEKKRGTGNLQNILWDEEFEKNLFCLIASKKLTAEQREYLLLYENKISRILKYHEAGEEHKRDEAINEYCQKFLREDDIMEFDPKMRKLVEILTHIVEGE